MSMRDKEVLNMQLVLIPILAEAWKKTYSELSDKFKKSVKRKTLKIRLFEDLSNGFTPRLHLLKVSYPMNDESAL